MPPAACLLVGAQLTQDKLSRRRLASLRYLATSVIYLSSTVEIFLHGVAQHAWLPVALGGMAIAGMLAGMLLRVRAFLFMGTAFLAVALFSVLWYAAVDAGQTWVWYVTGIVAGAAMIAAFAVLEKRRARVVEVVERLKRWEA